MHPWTTSQTNYMYFMIFKPWTVRHSLTNLCRVRGINSLCNGHELFYLHNVLKLIFKKQKARKQQHNEVNQTLVLAGICDFQGCQVQSFELQCPQDFKIINSTKYNQKKK